MLHSKACTLNGRVVDTGRQKIIWSKVDFYQLYIDDQINVLEW